MHSLLVHMQYSHCSSINRKCVVQRWVVWLVWFTLLARQQRMCSVKKSFMTGMFHIARPSTENVLCKCEFYGIVWFSQCFNFLCFMYIPDAHMNMHALQISISWWTISCSHHVCYVKFEGRLHKLRHWFVLWLGQRQDQLANRIQH